MKEALALARRAVEALNKLADAHARLASVLESMHKMELEQDARNAAASAALMAKHDLPQAH